MTTSWQTASAGAWSQDDWYGTPGCLPSETPQQIAEREEREEKWKNEARTALQLAVAQSGYDELGKVDYDKICTLSNALEACEAGTLEHEGLPEDELANARQELQVLRKALRKEGEDLEVYWVQRRAAEEERKRAQLEGRCRADLKGHEAGNAEEHSAELAAAAKTEPSQQGIM